MGLKLLLIVLLIKIVTAKITLDVNIENKEASVSYDGTETRTLTEDELHTLIKNDDLRQAFLNYSDDRSFYLKEGDCGPSNRVISIKSAIVKRLNMEPVIVVSQDFENSSNHTIKVNTGISHSVQNTLTTSWSKEHQKNISKDIEYEFKVGFGGFGARFQRKTGYSFSTKGGVSEEKSKTETIGTTSGMEVELKPGDAITVVLSANAGVLEIEVEHEATVKGRVPIVCNCDEAQGFGGYVEAVCEYLEEIMLYGHFNNSFTTTQTIKFNYYVDSSIQVYEKQTGVLIL